MLARLDEIPGVSRSRAECSGHYFLLELADGVADGIAARALEVVGRAAQVLSPEDADAQQEARRRGEPWLTSEEARSLSFVEGRMLGVRVGAAVAERVGLTAEERQALAEAVREEMFAHVELIHAGLAEAGRFFEAWPQLAARAAARCGGLLGHARVEIVTSALADHFRDGAARP